MRSFLVLCCIAGLVLGGAAALTDPDYSSALGLSWLFYEAQQSGNIACWNRVAWWQPGGYRVPSHLTDGSSENLDLSGGWYDAGDHIKNTQALGWAVSTLAWGALEFPQAYEATKQKAVMMRNLKWAADWIVKAHYQASDDPKKNGLVGQVGDPSLDHQKWWKPNDEATGFCRAVMKVTCQHPGSDVASEAAAALAAVSILFKDTDGAYAATLMTHAKQLYAFAKACPGIWSLIDKATIYPSNSFRDDLAWASAWLCKADASYCKEAVQMWEDGAAESKGKFNSDWDNVFAQATVLLMSTPVNTGDRTSVQKYISYMETLTYYWQDNMKNCTKDAQDYKTCLSSNGLLFTTRWGNMPKAANVALLSLTYAKHLSSKSNRVKRRCWARQQLALMLGGSGRSYMVGFGDNSPKAPHHRAASCPTDACKQCGVAPYNLAGDKIDGIAAGANPNVLWGALVGGQDNQAQYTDALTNYQQNEAAVDWNAGIAGALAGMVWFQNAFPATSWSKYCSQNLAQDESGLFDDENPSTAVKPVVPTLNVTIKATSTPANSPASPPVSDYLKTLLDPDSGMSKCGGNANAPGPAPTCNPPTVVGNQYAQACQSNYYGEQKKEAARKNAATSSAASMVLGAISVALAVLML